MPFDLESIKNTIRDTLRSYLYPQCLYGSEEINLSTSESVIEVAQSFKPFSKFYKNTVPFSNTVPVTIKIKKKGNPDDDIVVSLQSSYNSQPSGSTIGAATILSSEITESFNTIEASIPISSMLGSNTEYWIVISPLNSPSTTNCYVLCKFQ